MGQRVRQYRRNAAWPRNREEVFSGNGSQDCFASGYSEEEVTDDEQEHILGFVGKPYRPDDLAQTVRAALDKSKGKSRRLAACSA